MDKTKFKCSPIDKLMWKKRLGIDQLAIRMKLPSEVVKSAVISGEWPEKKHIAKLAEILGVEIEKIVKYA